MQSEYESISNWVAIDGRWDIRAEALRYDGPDPDDDGTISRSQSPGLLVSNAKFDGGAIRTTVKLESAESAARILLGYGSRPLRWIAAGIGGDSEAYVLSERGDDAAWRRLAGAGRRSHIEACREYAVELALDGQRLRMEIDDIPIIDHVLDKPVSRQQVGLAVWGSKPVEFSAVEIVPQIPSAFVVMQLNEQFNELFDEVISPVCQQAGIEAYRASDIYSPGVILQDIIRGLTESYVVIAEITKENPNVFYELGYSHALGKPTILLADQDRSTLPFDVSSYRVICYENTIRGKRVVERELASHLNNILNG